MGEPARPSSDEPRVTRSTAIHVENRLTITEGVTSLFALLGWLEIALLGIPTGASDDLYEFGSSARFVP